jgi:hypothetical protein
MENMKLADYALAILKDRNVSDETADILLRIFDNLETRGFQPEQECISVILVALRYLGLPYLRTEELADKTIDCSTLTSQAHWEGAAVGIPFVAENQRTAKSGEPVAGLADILPGDVVVKYESLEDTPDGIYNHVGIVIGWDEQGSPWIVESASSVGVRISPLASFQPKGGIKRFLPRPLDIFPIAEAESLQRTAETIPKFGRFGVRQYSKKNSQRFEHLGIDIYCPTQTPVFAPISGVARFSHLEREDSVSINIFNEQIEAFCSLANINYSNSIYDGATINEGNFIGTVIPPSSNSEIKYVDTLSDVTHLHIAYASKIETYYGNIRRGEWIYHNPLYACKVKDISLPVEFSDLR